MSIRVGREVFSSIQRWQRGLQNVQREFDPKWIKALNDAGDIAHKYFDRQFDSQGGEFGRPWRQLAPSTQRDRMRRGYRPARPILVRRGWLRASVASKTSAHARRTVNRNGITLWSTLTTKTGGHNLYEIHHRGTSKIPARPIHNESPPWISTAGWSEIEARFMGMFVELRRLL